MIRFLKRVDEVGFQRTAAVEAQKDLYSVLLKVEKDQRDQATHPRRRNNNV